MSVSAFVSSDVRRNGNLYKITSSLVWPSPIRPNTFTFSVNIKIKISKHILSRVATIITTPLTVRLLASFLLLSRHTPLATFLNSFSVTTNGLSGTLYIPFVPYHSPRLILDVNVCQMVA